MTQFDPSHRPRHLSSILLSYSRLHIGLPLPWLGDDQVLDLSSMI